MTIPNNEFSLHRFLVSNGKTIEIEWTVALLISCVQLHTKIEWIHGKDMLHLEIPDSKHHRTINTMWMAASYFIIVVSQRLYSRKVGLLLDWVTTTTQLQSNAITSPHSLGFKRHLASDVIFKPPLLVF